MDEGEVKRMLKERGFFDGRWNEAGRGIFHLYELRKRWGGKVVIDHSTGLMWQQEGSDGAKIFAAVEEYVRDLNAKRFAGFSDWSLPTLEEAMSLIEREEKSGRYYLDDKFSRAQISIWTADKLERGRAWVVYFHFGYCLHSHVGLDTYVRVVRRGQSTL